MTQEDTTPVANIPGIDSGMRVFLTGASGYVGRNLIRQLRASGVAVVALVRSQTSADLVQRLGAEPFIGDVLDPTIEQGMKGCDVLVHAAADTQHGRGTAQQKRTNEEGTRTVFEAARAAGIGKAIHISTESVLAAGAPLVNVDETHPLPRKPAGEYSRSKGAAEKIALAFNSTDFPVVALRPRFVWGRDDSTALPTIVAAVRAGQFAWISGGTYLTSTIHIGNLCAAIEGAIHRGRGGEVYFVADDEPVQFRQFLTQLLETQGIQAPDKSVPRAMLRVIAHMGDLMGAVSGGRIKAPLTLQSFATSAVNITLNIDKARRELDYMPIISREQGLDELRTAANL